MIGGLYLRDGSKLAVDHLTQLGAFLFQFAAGPDREVLVTDFVQQLSRFLLEAFEGLLTGHFEFSLALRFRPRRFTLQLRSPSSQV